ncbi:MAG: cell division protein ZapA [Rhodospirillaceae bacterium]|nr:cell division protein ZapA [Rhodospirillaceae bacterium]
MGQVSITIRGRNYQITCDDGQEAHLARLGRYLDQQSEQLTAATGSISDALMMVMVALTVADELADATSKLEALNSGSRAAQDKIDTGTATLINGLAKRIEDIAAVLERP